AFEELINRHGRPIIRALRVLINRQELNNSLIYEGLVSIGRLQNSNTESDRFELLVGLLDHHAPIVRDGAIMGLSFMDNKKAIPYLRKTLTKETVRALRENIEVAISDLETP
ncbi:HEAT repeat domain-containing protein, partial [Chloroflexota bacterium]